MYIWYVCSLLRYASGIWDDFWKIEREQGEWKERQREVQDACDIENQMAKNCKLQKKNEKKGIKRTKSFANPLAAKTHKWQRRPYFSFSSHWLLPRVHVYVRDSAKATTPMHIEPLYQLLLPCLFRSIACSFTLSLYLVLFNSLLFRIIESHVLGPESVCVSVCVHVCVVENMSCTFRKNWKEKKCGKSERMKENWETTVNEHAKQNHATGEH